MSLSPHFVENTGVDFGDCLGIFEAIERGSFPVGLPSGLEKWDVGGAFEDELEA